jgi:hypothetical protein
MMVYALTLLRHVSHDTPFATDVDHGSSYSFWNYWNGLDSLNFLWCFVSVESHETYSMLETLAPPLRVGARLLRHFLVQSPLTRSCHFLYEVRYFLRSSVCFPSFSCAIPSLDWRLVYSFSGEEEDFVVWGSWAPHKSLTCLIDLTLNSAVKCLSFHYPL